MSQFLSLQLGILSKKFDQNASGMNGSKKLEKFNEI